MPHPIGSAENAKQYYQKTLDEFPKSMMAKMGLQAIETFGRNESKSVIADANESPNIHEEP
jgi:hypothetical protein